MGSHALVSVGVGVAALHLYPVRFQFHVSLPRSCHSLQFNNHLAFNTFLSMPSTIITRPKSGRHVLDSNLYQLDLLPNALLPWPHPTTIRLIIRLTCILMCSLFCLPPQIPGYQLFIPWLSTSFIHSARAPLGGHCSVARVINLVSLLLGYKHELHNLTP